MTGPPFSCSNFKTYAVPAALALPQDIKVADALQLFSELDKVADEHDISILANPLETISTHFEGLTRQVQFVTSTIA